MGKNSKKKPAAAVKRRTPGRPRAEITRERRLPVRVSPEEIEELRAAAAASGETITEYVRRRLGLPATGYASVAE